MDTALLRGLSVLEALAGMRQPAGLAAVSARTNLSQSQAFRALQALDRAGYVEHVGRRGYRIGSRSVAMAAMIGPQPALIRAVFPVLSHLVRTTGHSATLHLRSGSDRVLVLGIPAPNDPTRETVSTGERSSLGVGCSGRVILAHLPEDDAAVTQLGAPDGVLRAIRARGYDTSLGENHSGVNGVAGPLRQEDGTAIGSISIAGLAERLPERALPELVAPLLGACAELSRRLGNVLGPNPGRTIDALDLN